MSAQPDAKPATSRGGRGARRRILAAATDLFYRQGINATGVERLASEASVSKRTLYQHFPSKAAVVEEYLRLMQEGVGDLTQPAPDAPGDTARGRLLALFDRPVVPGAPMRGCPFHNAAVEVAGTMPEVEHLVHTQKRTYIDGLTDLAKQAGAADPQLLGYQLAVLHEGAAALATSLNDPAPWAHARAAAQTLIDHAVQRP